MVRSAIPLCYHTDESVIPQTSQYYFYSRGILGHVIIGVIVHGHVINIYILTHNSREIGTQSMLFNNDESQLLTTTLLTQKQCF